MPRFFFLELDQQRAFFIVEDQDDSFVAIEPGLPFRQVTADRTLGSVAVRGANPSRSISSPAASADGASATKRPSVAGPRLLAFSLRRCAIHAGRPTAARQAGFFGRE